LLTGTEVSANNGDVLDLDEDNEVDDVELQWFKKNINAQVLPNGYCRLPVVAGGCPHESTITIWKHLCIYIFLEPLKLYIIDFIIFI
jgi:hypothetical protein